MSRGTVFENTKGFMRQVLRLAVFPCPASSLAAPGENLMGDGLTAAWNPWPGREGGSGTIP